MHTHNQCPIRAFKGTVEDINLVKEEALEWMSNLQDLVL